MLTKKRILISLIFYLLVLIWIISLKMNMKDAVFGCMDYFKQFTLQERFKISLSTFRLSKIIFDADFLVNICFFMPLGAYCFELIKKNKFIKGLFIAMPSKKNKDGEFKDIAHPINPEARQKLSDPILDAFAQAI